jgi:predicted O-methyltransferase YrrM
LEPSLARQVVSKLASMSGSVQLEHQRRCVSLAAHLREVARGREGKQVRIMSHIRSVTGANRWVLTTLLKHPAKTVAFATGKRDEILMESAWSAAKRLGGPLSSGMFDKRKEFTVVRDIQTQLRKRANEWRQLDPSGMLSFKGPLLYFLVRFTNPGIVVETGVASGISSTFILLSLRQNGLGRLVSIDLPNTDPDAQIPENQKSGWIVPDKLRHAWELRIGDSRTLLPEVLQENGTIDLFLHDSLHTYEHMIWEYRESWPALRPQGFLVSDDVVSNAAFSDFCAEENARGIVRYGLGIAEKGEISVRLHD